MSELGRLLVFAGAALLVVGVVVWLLGSALPLGRLPGDLSFGRGNTRVSIPLATSLLLSLVLTILLNIALRLFDR
jgi:fumarate reductase subunit D